jgi:AAA15 family ATPase/GTPase
LIILDPDQTLADKSLHNIYQKKFLEALSPGVSRTNVQNIFILQQKDGE